MAVAETAQLVVLLQLKDEMSGSVAKAEAQLAGLNRTAGGTGTAAVAAERGMSRLGVATTAVGGALSHAKSQLGGLISGPLGFIGLAAASGGAAAVIGTSVRKVEDFGAALEKVQTLTGETALQSGALILTFQKYGLGVDKIGQLVGFAEKSLGKLNSTAATSVKVGKSQELQNLELVKAQRVAAGESTKAVDALIKEQKARDQIAAAATKQTAGLTKLQMLDKQYGLSLVDSSGKVVSYSELLSQLATFYDSNASASTKAYVASQLLGRGYTTLIPVLNEGSAGLRRAAADAAALGLGSQDTVKQLGEFHDQMHALENQANLLQLSIGVALLPSLIDLSRAATDFVQQNRAGIVDFFRQGAQFAKDFAGAVSPLVGALGGILGWWGKLPSELKTLLIGGFVANKALKWTFGFSGIDILKGLGGTTGLFGRGAPGNPMHVFVDGGVGGVGGGGTNWLGVGAAAAGGLAIAAWVKGGGLNELLRQIGVPTNWTDPALSAQSQGIVANTQRMIAQGASPQALRDALSAVKGGLGYFNAGPLTDFLYGSQIADLKAAQSLLENAIGGAGDPFHQHPRGGGLSDPSTKLDTAGDKLIEAATIIHNAPLFHQAADIRKQYGVQYSGQVLGKILQGGVAPSEVAAGVTTGEAISLALVNALRTPGNENADLKSARYNLDRLVALQRGLPVGIRSQLNGPIASLRAAINAVNTTIRNKTFYLNYTPTGFGTGTARPGDTRSELHVQTTVSSRDVAGATTVSRSNGGSQVWRGNRQAPGSGP